MPLHQFRCGTILRYFPSATATGQRKATVPLTSYEKYNKEVTIHHGLELVGWPFPTVVSFPAVPHDLASLHVLLDALQSNECHFRSIDPEKLTEIRRKYYEPLLIQTLRSTVEQDSAVDIGRSHFAGPNRKGKSFHLNTPELDVDSGAKRCSTV